MVNPRFWTGYRDCAPFILVAAPFGMLFGVAATEAGMDLLSTMVMTVVVIAGASQFTALVLLQENAPTLIVIVTALAVNLRMAMYAAALAPWFRGTAPGMRLLLAYFNLDQNFGLASLRFPEEPDWTRADRVAYFLGAALAITPWWVTFTLVGALAGSSVPDWLSLDFALPICFIAIVGPGLRSLPHIAAAVVSVVAALSLSWVPYSLGLIIAALIAMATGAALELMLERRAK